jgi:predicted regulator of Ras-like GTPase activity (Roadblock/LC7/MglB family)
MIDPTIRAVLVDVSLASLDGFALLERMAASSIGRVRGTPVLAVAGHEDVDALDRAIGLGAADCVSRGTDAAFLAARLESLLRGTRADRPIALPLDGRAPGRAGAGAGTGTVADRAPSFESHQALAVATCPPAAIVTAATTPVHAAHPAPFQVRPPKVARDGPSDEPRDLPKERPMARFESLTKVLKTLQSQSPGVEASALISEDGLMIASALSQDFDETRVAGMTATLLNLGTRAATELRRGEVKEVIVRGEQGYAVMISAGRGAVLLVLAAETTPLGLIFFDMREAIKAIKTIL